MPLYDKGQIMKVEKEIKKDPLPNIPFIFKRCRQGSLYIKILVRLLKYQVPLPLVHVRSLLLM